MTILAVDATGEVLSAALLAGARTLRVRRKGRSDEALLPAVESLLKKAGLRWKDLDAVAAAAGPGRFTGIRVGLAFAEVAAFQLKIPALALSRLEAAAEKAGGEDCVAALAGWKGEVYHQRFKKGAPRGPAEWTAAERWPAVRADVERKGLAVVEGDVDAADLLPVAARRLAARRIPPFAPFYLKPAGYERPAR